MIRFKGFDFDDTARYSEYLGKCIQIPSDMSPLKIFAWRIITEEDDNMDILRGYEADLCWHKILVGSDEYWTAPMGDWDAACWPEIFTEHVPSGTEFRLVPEYLANLWKKKLGAAVQITEDRDSWDYILSMDRLKDPSGSRFTQLRRGKSIFEDNYDYEIVEFSPDVFDELREFQTEAEEDIVGLIKNKDAAHFFENGLLFVIDSWDFYPEAFKSLYGFLIKVDGVCAGYVINEQIDASHAIGLFYAVEGDYKGIAEFARWLDAKRNYERGILTVNVMDDIGEEHLRSSKESLAPIVMLKKFTVKYDAAAVSKEPETARMETGGVRTSIKRNGESRVIGISGRLDTYAAGTISDPILKELDGASDVIFDLDGLDYISSAGLRILLSSLKKVKGAGGSLTLQNISPGVREILEMTGMSYIFELD